MACCDCHLRPLLLLLWWLRTCRWQDRDFSSWSVISYPDRLQDYVLREFARIKLHQARLLGFKPPKGPDPRAKSLTAAAAPMAKL
jgi:hypothetical protein